MNVLIACEESQEVCKTNCQTAWLDWLRREEGE